MSTASNTFEHNPFATRYVRPGSIPYCFPAGIDAAQLVDRLAASGWRGQIVGRHGSGKSTLLAALLPAIEAQGRSPHLVALHDGQRRLPERLPALPTLDERTVVVVDGYEQLGHWSRWTLGRLCRRRGWGLLVTAHRPVGLPPLLETVTSVELAAALVDRLTQGTAAFNPHAIDRREIAVRFAARGGNLREVLFDCYDLYQKGCGPHRTGDARSAGRGSA